MATNEPERGPSWLERLEGDDPDPEAASSAGGPSAPAADAADRERVPAGTSRPGPSARSLDDDIELPGIVRLREEASRAARDDAAVGVPDPESTGPTQSERDLRERCRAFYDRWSFQHRRRMHDGVAEREELITDRLGRASLALDKFERLTNELMRLKARRAVRHREVTDDLNRENAERGLSTRIYLIAIAFLGLVEFFANAPVFNALLPRDALTERQIRLVTETSQGWFAGVERVFAQLILRPDSALLAAGVVTFLCVLAHFFGHSLRELVILRDSAERHHKVAARSSTESIIPMILTGVGLLLVLGVLYEARIRLGEVGQEQYRVDHEQAQEWERQANFFVSDGQLLEANALRAQAQDLEQAAQALRDYSTSMSRLSFPILLLNLTLVICALSAAYFHRRDHRREHFNDSPFERDRLKIIQSGEETAAVISDYLSDLAKRIRDLKSLTSSYGAEEPRGVVRELESVISLYRAENGRARGVDPRTISAFGTPVTLDIEIENFDDEEIQPLRSPTEYNDERRLLQDRFQTVRERFNEEAISW